MKENKITKFISLVLDVIIFLPFFIILDWLIFNDLSLIETIKKWIKNGNR